MDKLEKILIKELQELYGFSDSYIESLQDGLLITNTEGKILLVNTALSQITGFDKTELLNADLPFPFWPPEYRKDYKALFEKQSSGYVKREFQVVYMHKNGGVRFSVSVFFASILDAHEKVIAYIGFIQDAEEEIAQKTKNTTNNNNEILF